MVEQDTVKNAVYENTSSWWKSGLGLLVPILRVNEVKRKATVAAAQHQDAVIDALDGTVDKLAAAMGMKDSGVGKATALPGAARDAVYSNTEGMLKTAAVVLFPFAGFLRANEVSRKSAVAIAERQQAQLQIVDIKLNQIAGALGVDISDLDAVSQGSARNAVYDTTSSTLKSGAALAPIPAADIALNAATALHIAAATTLAPVAVATDYIASGASMLRTNEVSRHSVGASAAFQDLQVNIMEEKTRRIAHALGLDPEVTGALESRDSRSADEKVMEETRGTGQTALAILFGSAGAMFRENQVSRKAVSAATEHQEERLARLSNCLEAIINNAASQRGVVNKDMAKDVASGVIDPEQPVGGYSISAVGNAPKTAAALKTQTEQAERAAKQVVEAGKENART